MGFDIFKNTTNEELFEIYKNIIGSEELGIRPKSLDPYLYKLKETFKFPTFSQIIDFTQKLYYKEIANRFFKDIK